MGSAAIPQNDENPTRGRRLILRAGEQVLYTTAVNSNTQQAAVLGYLKSGIPAIHFRNFRIVGRDAWHCTNEGATFTIEEMIRVVTRIRELFKAVPELTVGIETDSAEHE